MKKHRLLLLSTVLFLLVACSNEQTTSSIFSSLISQEEITSSSEESNSLSSNSSSSSFSSSSSYLSSSSSSSTSVSSSSSSSSSEAGVILPIGNRTVSGPNNKNNKDDISDWTNYEFDGYLPDNWSAIHGNNKVNNGDFYADGSYKFSHLYYGLQTPMFNSWKKIEIRFYISQVNNSTDKKKDGEPIFHIYGYNENEEYIQFDTLEQGSITSQSEGNFVRIYIRNIDVSYLEFRLNANPYKGTQCYNFGVSKIGLKGWDYE